ncbi:mfs [Trichoderma arundinaceum]|uniref:Mfs n=1 Tax=Trichoderma arundinaceum TaxID=490622 RepID=A0A395NN68_TRIAR|nr:mfs [Trichoderma arundinaceum]
MSATILLDLQTNRSPRINRDAIGDSTQAQMIGDISFLPNEHEAITTATPQLEPLNRVRARRANTLDRSSDEIYDQSSRLPFRRLIAAYLCLSIIYFTSSLDINSVALALPNIAGDLSAGSGITWAGTAYLMGQAALQPLYGRLSDIFGRKPLLMLSVGFLVFGDLLCANSQSPAWLYACRAISGIGGGGISSIISIIVSDLVSLKDRGKYQGMLNASIGAGSATGPFLAAALIQKTRIAGISSWRWIFYIPPILACVSAVASMAFLPLTSISGSWRAKVSQIDWMGLATSLIATICILTFSYHQIPLNLGGTSWAWSSPAVISLMIIGSAAVAAFAIVEKRYARIPLIPLRLFTNRATAILLIQSALYNVVWQIDMYFMPAYFQDIRGFSPLQASALMLPILLFSSVSGVLSGPAMTIFERQVQSSIINPLKSKT